MDSDDLLRLREIARALQMTADLVHNKESKAKNGEAAEFLLSLADSLELTPTVH